MKNDNFISEEYNYFYMIDRLFIDKKTKQKHLVDACYKNKL